MIVAYACVVVNGDVLLDADLSQWRHKPPEEFTNLIRPDSQNRPWMKAVLVALSDALLTGAPVVIEATTSGNGWRMGVDYR